MTERTETFIRDHAFQPRTQETVFHTTMPCDRCGKPELDHLPTILEALEALIAESYVPVSEAAYRRCIHCAGQRHRDDRREHPHTHWCPVIRAEAALEATENDEAPSNATVLSDIDTLLRNSDYADENYQRILTDVWEPIAKRYFPLRRAGEKP